MAMNKHEWNGGIWIVIGVLVAAYLPVVTSHVVAKQITDEGVITLNFQDTSIRVVITFISELTGRDFIVDRKVKGQVTVICPTKITSEEAYRMLESILEVEGYTTVPADRMIRIVPATDAKSMSIDTISDLERRIVKGEPIVTRIIHLSYIDSNSVASIIRPLMSKRKSSLVTY
jgi:general secretion pathway protein D